MKKIFLILSVCLSTITLVSCGGMDVEEPISFSSSSSVNDPDAISVVSVSSPSLMKTGALQGRITCSVKFKKKKDFGDVSSGYCKIYLLDKNGAEIIGLHASDFDDLDEFVSSSVGTSRKIAFESTKKDQSNLKEIIKQAKAIKVEQMSID